MLSPQELSNYNEFKKNQDLKFLSLMIKEAIDAALNGHVARVNEASKELHLYTIKEICELFRVTPATVHNWRKRGWIIGKRLGKNRFFSRDEVDSAMRIYQVGSRY